MSGGEQTWRMFEVFEPKNRPAERLEIAVEMARERGLATDRVLVAQATADETTAPAGMELVVSPLVHRWEYRFELGGRR
jgi:hypothetical protein